MPVLSQGRQSKDLADAPLQRPFYHPRVIRHGKNQIPVLSKTIGKYIDGAQIRQGILQYPAVYKGICITAGKQGPSSLPGFPVRDIKSLANGQAVWIFYLICPYKGLYGNPLGFCDGVNTVSLFHYIYFHAFHSST